MSFTAQAQPETLPDNLLGWNLSDWKNAYNKGYSPQQLLPAC